MDTIRGVVVSVQENESACVSFVESMPSYADLKNWQDFSVLQKMEYIWYKDEVARASHSMFVGFISSGKDSNQDERVSLKEQLVFYYMERSLAEYPGTTLFKGMASGVVALVRHLPTGSPAIFYCINSLVVKADRLYGEVFAYKADIWKNWQGESEPCKEIIEVLLRLISLVDIQASTIKLDEVVGIADHEVAKRWTKFGP
ncbi:hypothetical protein CUMW_167380 [Citrus unshiu]|uniref:Uncharacterized protein n=1 Tax=Citrus unshiu TaxID=55188 RepID=A0A2H5PU36_CITUN|nr:hypothetical protein CUMW_167380 [Citrus unshiu]